VIAAGLLVVACGDSGRESRQTGDVERWEETRAGYVDASDTVVQSVSRIGGSLESLTEEQKAVVAALMVSTRLATLAEASATPEGRRLAEEFWRSVPDFCPPMPPPAAMELGGCLDESIAYARAMQSCLDEEGTSEQDCERRAGEEAAAEIACLMGRIEELGRLIGRIPGGPWRSPPFP